MRANPERRTLPRRTRRSVLIALSAGVTFAGCVAQQDPSEAGPSRATDSDAEATGTPRAASGAADCVSLPGELTGLPEGVGPAMYTFAYPAWMDGSLEGDSIDLTGDREGVTINFFHSTPFSHRSDPVDVMGEPRGEVEYAGASLAVVVDSEPGNAIARVNVPYEDGGETVYDVAMFSLSDLTSANSEATPSPACTSAFEQGVIEIARTLEPKS